MSPAPVCGRRSPLWAAAFSLSLFQPLSARALSTLRAGKQKTLEARSRKEKQKEIQKEEKHKKVVGKEKEIKEKEKERNHIRQAYRANIG